MRRFYAWLAIQNLLMAQWALLKLGLRVELLLDVPGMTSKDKGGSIKTWFSQSTGVN